MRKLIPILMALALTSSNAGAASTTMNQGSYYSIEQDKKPRKPKPKPRMQKWQCKGWYANNEKEVNDPNFVGYRMTHTVTASSMSEAIRKFVEWARERYFRIRGGAECVSDDLVS